MLRVLQMLHEGLGRGASCCDGSVGALGGIAPLTSGPDAIRLGPVAGFRPMQPIPMNAFMRHVLACAATMLTVACAQSQSPAAVAARYEGGLDWKAESAVRGDFTCRGQAEHAVLGVGGGQIVVAIFAEGLDQRPTLLRFPATMRDPVTSTLTVESLDIDLDRLGAGSPIAVGGGLDRDRLTDVGIVVLVVFAAGARRDAGDALAELPQPPTERTTEVGQLPRAEDDQRDDQDDRYFGNSDLGDHWADRTARAPAAPGNGPT